MGIFMLKYILLASLLVSSLVVWFVHGEDKVKIVATYGTWESPITPEKITEKVRSAGDVTIDQGHIYWTEFRPSEQGKVRILTYDDAGEQIVLTPDDVNVKTKVYEYGGKAYAVDGNKVYYVNFQDQRVYLIENKQPPIPITEDGIRYADFRVSPAGLIAVAESHSAEATRYQDVKNYLALIHPVKGTKILEEGRDFYSSPALSPDGSKLAWLQWDHPNMPWDGTELWVADFNDGELSNKHKVTGGLTESIFQPTWSPSGDLYFVSDKSGWWNLYRLKNQDIEAIYPYEAEFGVPQWNLGSKTYAFTGRGAEIISTFEQNGISKLAFINPEKKSMTPIDLGFDDYGAPTVGPGYFVLSVGSYAAPRQLLKIDLESLKWEQIGPPVVQKFDPEYFSKAQFLKYPSANGRDAYAFYYPPTNKDYEGPKNEKPPLIVISHGGPTASTLSTLNLGIQFWTSRGFAVLDVDYGGSSGFGRAYRDLLKGNWGIVDVQDSENGAKYLIQQGLVDSDHIFIRGGSAGGYTTLASLAFTKTFAGGASYFGVSDLELLTKDTHKFEARYTDQLVGPYPEAIEIYRERSPVFHANQITSPVIFFQGGEDRIVPLNQAVVMHDALLKNHIPTELIVYPTEGHGFRQAENIHDSMNRELQFYQDIINNKAGKIADK